MVKFKNVEEITKSFINDGWNESTTFSELSEKKHRKRAIASLSAELEKEENILL